MGITNRKSQNNQFLLEAGEIDRIMEELMKFLSDEPIDRKDALRLRFLLEETISRQLASSMAVSKTEKNVF